MLFVELYVSSIFQPINDFQNIFEFSVYIHHSQNLFGIYVVIVIELNKEPSLVVLSQNWGPNNYEHTPFIGVAFEQFSLFLYISKSALRSRNS